MKTIKVSEAEGAALDWLVASIEYPNDTEVKEPELAMPESYDFSSNWGEGGPIVDREGISLRAIRKPGHSFDGLWLAIPADTNTGETVRWHERQHGSTGALRRWQGPTALIAAMRCFVASKLGETAKVPEELVP